MNEAEVKPELAWMQSFVLDRCASLPLKLLPAVTLVDFVSILSSSLSFGLSDTQRCPTGDTAEASD